MYFSVKQPIKIAGKTFQPCICYTLTEFFKPNVEKLVSEDKATFYENPVSFQNGKIISPGIASASIFVEEEKKKAKISKSKSSKTEIKESVKEEPEKIEIALEDETGGF